jgi:hypothetical protein
MRLRKQRSPKKTLKNKVDIRHEKKMRKKVQTIKALTLAASTAGSARRMTKVLAITSLKHLLTMKTRRSLA